MQLPESDFIQPMLIEWTFFGLEGAAYHGLWPSSIEQAQLAAAAAAFKGPVHR